MSDENFIESVEIQGRMIYTDNTWYLVFKCPKCEQRYKFNFTKAMK